VTNMGTTESPRKTIKNKLKVSYKVLTN
jgi:hypothetical protein